MTKQFSRAILFSLVCILLITCKKDSFITSGNAAFSISVDSLKYDTVFTTVGSVTQSFKINNPNNQKLLLNKVKLMGGATSAYKININGLAGPEVNDIELGADDSIYVFVTVKIDPADQTLPFIVKDSIQIIYNGNTRFIQLEAFGQNAHFLHNQVISGNVIWPNDLPYVITGSLRIDTTASLTILNGCRIYAHADAPVIVDGKLIIDGTKNDSVVFAGDRLDPDYRDLPASWPGIYFRGSSKDNVLTHVIIKNAYQAIAAEKPADNFPAPKVTLHKCIIDNAYDAGIICVNSSLQADNCLITNCGTNVTLAYGGDYNFFNCTVAAYSGFYINHKNPVLVINNFAENNTTNSLHAGFTNCIFWGEFGDVKNEVSVTKKGNDIFDVSLMNCLYKVETDPDNTDTSHVIKNVPPLFDSIDVNKRYYDFHITNGPGVNMGKNVFSFSQDLDDKAHIDPFDLGCYEKQ